MQINITMYKIIMPYRERLRDRPYEARQPAFMSVVPIPAEEIPKDEERLKCI